MRNETDVLNDLSADLMAALVVTHHQDKLTVEGHVSDYFEISTNGKQTTSSWRLDNSGGKYTSIYTWYSDPNDFDPYEYDEVSFETYSKMLRLLKEKIDPTKPLTIPLVRNNELISKVLWQCIETLENIAKYEQVTKKLGLRLTKKIIEPFFSRRDEVSPTDLACLTQFERDLYEKAQQRFSDLPER